MHTLQKFKFLVSSGPPLLIFIISIILHSIDLSVRMWNVQKKQKKSKSENQMKLGVNNFKIFFDQLKVYIKIFFYAYLKVLKICYKICLVSYQCLVSACFICGTKCGGVKRGKSVHDILLHPHNLALRYMTLKFIL
jgi:hypothetical protein